MSTRSLQLVLAAAAIACTVSTLPSFLHRPSPPPALGITGLMVVALIQTISLPADAVGGQLHWVQGATGWCLLPLLLRMPTSRAAAHLIGYWVVPAALALLRSPQPDTLVNIGLGTASILTVQLCVLMIYQLLGDAATAAHIETTQRVQLLAREQLSQALAAEYDRRYSQLITNVVPLLEALRAQQPLDESIRRSARVECQHMRVLFDQSASFDHPLLQRLRPSIDTAEARDIDVSLHIDGEVPDLDDATVDRVLAVLGYALQVAQTSARIALSSDAAGLTASIVCPDLVNPQRFHEHPGMESADLELTITDNLAWLTVRCTAPSDNIAVRSSTSVGSAR